MTHEDTQRLLAAFAHELRTPLAAIGGFTELLRLGVRGPLTDAQAADLLRIQANQQLMVHALDDLMAYVAAVAAQPTPAGVVEDVGARVRDVARTLEHAPVGARIDVDVPGDAIVCARITADAHVFDEVLRVLLQDALRHSGGEGRVRVRVRQADAAVVIECETDGAGFTDLTAAAYGAAVSASRTRMHDASGIGTLAVPRAAVLLRTLGGSLQALASAHRLVCITVPAAAPARIDVGRSDAA